MLRRSLEVDLDKWKDSPVRKVLILRGARQVGKTSTVRKWGKDKFDELVEINLEKNEHKEWMSGVVSVEDFAGRVERNLNQRLIDGRTLLFVDEAQELVEVMELLRFFAEERPNLHVIVAGSLMEAKLAKVKWSVPVGRVEYMYMYPLSFFEYLEARGKGLARDHLLNWELGQVGMEGDIGRKMYEEYMWVGGLPEAVASYQSEQSLLVVQEVQSRLYNSYWEDIGKYASEVEKKYLEVVLAAAPRLAGKLFSYENMGESGYKSREIGEAVGLIEKTMILRQVKAINSTTLPVWPKRKRAKKMVWLDTGIVNYVNKMQGVEVVGRYKGAVMEQVVGQTLVMGGKREKVKVHYWARNRDEGSAEVDFVVQKGQKLVAFEVKAGNGQAMKSLFSMMNSGGEVVVPVRVSWDPLGVESYQYAGREYRILSIPFYLLERWEELVEEYGKKLI